MFQCDSMRLITLKGFEFINLLCCINCLILRAFARWMPPPLPIAKSPEHEKESGTTFAAGRSRVLVIILGWIIK